jgi:hypothetical protein
VILHLKALSTGRGSEDEWRPTLPSWVVAPRPKGNLLPVGTTLPAPVVVAHLTYVVLRAVSGPLVWTSPHRVPGDGMVSWWGISLRPEDHHTVRASSSSLHQQSSNETPKGRMGVRAKDEPVGVTLTEASFGADLG